MAYHDVKTPWEGWRVINKIGKGGFGSVYEIERSQYGIHERAAMKVISIPQSADEIEDLLIEGYDDNSITRRFNAFAEDIVREYGMMAQMKGNANIVYCDDYRIIQQDNGFGRDIYIRMELLTPLLKAMDWVSSEQQIIRFGMEMCNALEACQKRKVIHRDIKPQNIFVSDDGVFKLGDFGIARKAEKTTRATVGKGTYQFMAPEVKNEQPYGPTVDIYSLGLVMYWLLNNRRCPFFPLPPVVPTHKEEQEALRRRFSGEQIPAPKNGNKELKRIVQKACAFDPKDRYQSAREMREDLMRLSGGDVRMWEFESIELPAFEQEFFMDDETVGPVFDYVSDISDTYGQDKTVGPDFRKVGDNRKKKNDEKNCWKQVASYVLILACLMAQYVIASRYQGFLPLVASGICVIISVFGTVCIGKDLWAKKTKKLRLHRIAFAALIILIVTVNIAILLNRFTEANPADRDEKTSTHVVEIQQQNNTAEIDKAIAKADMLAAQYYYDEAIALLKKLQVDTDQSQEIEKSIDAYEEQISKLAVFSDILSIPNISFNVLIADPDRAFTDEVLGTTYARNFVTVSEFEKILEQLYANNFILVNLTDVVQLNTESGVLEAHQLMLPAGKKPIILTETLVNYFAFMIDSDGDGYADAGGDGFASRLVVSDGEIKAEYVDAFGNTQIGNFDFVPILENFIKQHPDFAYHGARATLAVTGTEGVFGYRVNPSYIDTMGQDYVNDQIAQAKELVQVLREKGYNIACNTYSNSNYQLCSSAQIQSDIQLWNNEVLPILGDVNTMVFAKKSDLDDYSGSNLNILLDNGFGYFIGEGTSERNHVGLSYFHQNKLTITGEILRYQPDLLSSFFDADIVLSDQRREE